jgi:hypothetical protein
MRDEFRFCPKLEYRFFASLHVSEVGRKPNKNHPNNQQRPIFYLGVAQLEYEFTFLHTNYQPIPLSPFIR